MITLITAVPGTGKTLYLLPSVEADRRRAKTPRQVFYSGINSLTLPWTQFGGPGPDPDRPWETDASEWYKLPKGSIIVIDEAQRLFRTRSAGSQVPAYVSALETHRHHGFDIYLVSQHPNLLDVNVRRLVGRHLHLKRLWRSPMMMLRGQPGRAAVHEWSECVSPINKAAISDAQRSEFFYPKEVFHWYKSAFVHTHGRRVPMRVLFLWCVPFIIVALGWVFYGRITAILRGDHIKQAAGVELADGRAGGGTAASSTSPVRKLLDFFHDSSPRVASMPWTAPKYDKLTVATRVPLPAACVQMGNVCRCYTQDATVLEVDAGMCREIVAKGMFFDFETRDVREIRSDRQGVVSPKGAVVERPAGDVNRSSGMQVPAVSLPSQGGALVPAEAHFAPSHTGG
jgi:zona occludens toxin